MDTKLYNSEVIELSKKMLISGVSVGYALKDAKELIDKLVEQGFYYTEEKQELSDEDKRINNLLRKDVREEFGVKLYWKMLCEFRMQEDPIIADIIRYGRKKLLFIRGLGKKTLTRVDNFFEENGLYWDMDLTKYGL